MKAEERLDLPYSTLDLLLMCVAPRGPLRGYATGQRIQQMSDDAVLVLQRSRETGRETRFRELIPGGRSRVQAETRNRADLTGVVGLNLKGTLEGL